MDTFETDRANAARFWDNGFPVVKRTRAHRFGAWCARLLRRLGL